MAVGDLVQTVKTNDIISDTSLVVTIDSATSGSLLIAVAGTGGETTVAVTDFTTAEDGFSSWLAQIIAYKYSTGGETSVTLTWSDAEEAFMSVYEVETGISTDPTDQGASNVNTGDATTIQATAGGASAENVMFFVAGAYGWATDTTVAWGGSFVDGDEDIEGHNGSFMNGASASFVSTSTETPDSDITFGATVTNPATIVHAFKLEAPVTDTVLPHFGSMIG